ncbi:hypothetical protein C8J57DRAFT_1073579 [Mycena rebaudengoi]|nr:hypothetical protein C8J57DRAFT_1073579 [Mycena rebaudengoi]
MSAVLAVSRLPNVAPQPAAQARIRDEWDNEVHTHEALLADWAREREEILSLRAELERDRENWKCEHVAQAQRHQEEEVEWEREIQAHADLQEVEWDKEIQDQHCLRHNARGYTARLAKVPRSYDPVQACRETAIEIPGVKIKGRPLKCEDRGCSGVFGHWIAESGESICATYFKNFDDKGCNSPGSRRRRIQSRLENLQFGDDWRKMCSTTPATFRHQHFPTPHRCDTGIFGVWGVWEIKDEKC